VGAHSLIWKTWLLPSSLHAWQKRALAEIRRRVPRDRDTVWILSSGTQSVNQVKAIGLKRQALLASASGVNAFLEVSRGDRWLLAIPSYHVGGFSIGVRAHLSRSRVFSLPKWNALAFCGSVSENKISLTSLVPTQIHDLVRSGLRAPPSLRAIVVDGGALDENLYLQARALGWPCLTSYGLTETASQVATASLATLARREYPGLTVLPHAKIETRDQRIFVRGESLCHWVSVSDGERFTLEDPRRDGWLPTEDLGELGAKGLRVLGRRDDVVKVLGVLVPLAQVRADLGLDRTEVIALSGGREGHRLVAVTDTAKSLAEVDAHIAGYNRRAAGPFRVQQWLWTPRLERTALGKFKKAELLARLNLAGES
jgi:O-succinylbenzoic acid--CoA ligase